VRLLPWLLDPSVTFRLAAPFARGLLALAAEAAILVGWPVGWTLAAVHVVERGEGRALAALGQSPVESVVRLWPQALVFACALGLVSFIGGRDASAPGRVVTDLIERGRESCESAPGSEPSMYAVPFAGVTWLCSPGFAPRLAGKGPGTLANAEFTARGARAAGDLREIELDDAHLHLPLASSPIDVHVGSLHLRGLSPFGHASRIPPLARGVALALAGVFAASFSLFGVLSGALRGRLAGIAVAASSSLLTLAAMRAIERASGTWIATLVVPLLTLASALLATAFLSRLPRRMRTASK
jgi:hypothetical protein